MSKKLEHHFVPQFFFRMFNGGQRYIHLLTLDDLRLVQFASIRGQCARHKYYGTVEVEDALAPRREGGCAASFSRFLRYAWDSTLSFPGAEHVRWLQEGILLQHGRTPRAVSMQRTAHQAMMLYAFREFVLSSPDADYRETTLRAIDQGRVQYRDSDVEIVLMSLRLAVRSVLAISDLKLAILRNHCSIPFLFGDSPVVFYNLYMWSIKGHGVLGFQSPGLMILLPLDPRTQVLLYDPGVYTCAVSERCTVEIVDVGDVAQINALQVHEAQENIYFADPSTSDYVQRLCAAHKPLWCPPHSEFLVHHPGDFVIDGHANAGELLHVYEPQLPLHVSFSFLNVAPLPPDEDLHRPRNAEIARRLDELHGIADTERGLPIQDIVSQMVIQPDD